MAKPKRLGKPSSPEEAQRKLREQRRQALEAVSISPEIADLLSGAEIEVTRAGQKREGQVVKEDSARRLDAFSALKDGMQVGCYDAARKFEHQILVRRGENDKGPSPERVDRTAGLVTDAMLDAGRWIDAVTARLPPRDWWLLMELINPRVDRPTWRDTVSYITGETHTHAQGAAVRAMTVNLRDAIETVEKATVEARRAA